MKLEILPARPTGWVGAWEIQVNLRKFTHIPSYRNPPWPDYYSDFTVWMDERFLDPFNCVRLGTWLRRTGKSRTYWTYVSMLEGK